MAFSPVIPVKLVLDLIGERESRFFTLQINSWIPAFAGMTERISELFQKAKQIRIMNIEL